MVNVTVTNTAAEWVPGIKRLVDAELANPTGSKVLQAEIEVGDLSDPAAKDALTAAAQTLVRQSPGQGDPPAA
jgi:hypothetical protein